MEAVLPNLSWNEIATRAEHFADRWDGETYEKGESQSFWSDFLDVFGIDRKRHGAYFEYAIKKNGGGQGFIDLFWPGKLLAEHKSLGRNLEAARTQAFDYLPAMPDADLPEAIVVSDFATFELMRLETREIERFALAELPVKIQRFGFLIGESRTMAVEEDPVNRTAAERMAELHNELATNGYTGHDLERFLVRMVFCLFADDARIFPAGALQEFIRNRTSLDGTDLGPKLIRLFDVLNQPKEKRQRTLDTALAAFPYVNGGLFAERIDTPDFSSAMRLKLLQTMELDWSKVSPAIFGAMFQGVMDEKQRRNLGAHYTSETNILKVIKPLFLDDLYDEFVRIEHDPEAMHRFHDKLAELHFLDPACGCGNFLVLTYRELRRLEHQVVQKLLGGKHMHDIAPFLKVQVGQMHGIEIEEFPALIAQTALWLTDHQMNLEATRMFGQPYVRLPLTEGANIANTNALTIDWSDIVPPEALNYILGNPPFLGHHLQSVEQKRQMQAVLKGIEASGVLDFVSAWFYKALEFTDGSPIEIGLVATNSITQGEQASILWSRLLEMGAKINFAHRTFKWSNEGRGVAAVYCVIVGFAHRAKPSKVLVDYPDIRSEGIPLSVSRINPYLVDAADLVIQNRTNPICMVPGMRYGNKPTDGGHFLLDDDQYHAFIAKEPAAASVIRPFLSAKEFLNGQRRWVIWLDGVEPDLIRSLPLVAERVEAVRHFRMASVAASTRDYPYHTLFRQITQPRSRFVLIPRHSSENREYIPMGFFTPEYIVADSSLSLPDATVYHFAILTSAIHMGWVRAVCGRLKSDYRYSKDIVYNNFPWPEQVSDEQRARIETLAQAVLDARAAHPNATLADLYDPNTMPPDLVKAHRDLDRAVDRLYRREGFETELERVEFLFEEYQRLSVERS